MSEHDRLFSAWEKKAEENKAKVLIIEIGAGTAIPTVRMVCEAISAKFDATLVRINPEESKISGAAPDVQHYSISEGAEAALRKIDEHLKTLIEKQNK